MATITVPTVGSTRGRSRWCVVAIGVAVTLLSVWFALWPSWASRQALFDPIPFNDVVKSAIELRLETSRSLLQMCLLSFAALWGFFITKEGVPHKVSESIQEFILFAGANIAMIASMFCHVWYSITVARYQADAGVMAEQTRDGGASPIIPDVFGPRINFLFDLQLWLLLTGLALVCLTAISLYFIKRTEGHHV